MRRRASLNPSIQIRAVPARSPTRSSSRASSRGCLNPSIQIRAVPTVPGAVHVTGRLSDVSIPQYRSGQFRPGLGRTADAVLESSQSLNTDQGSSDGLVILGGYLALDQKVSIPQYRSGQFRRFLSCRIWTSTFHYPVSIPQYRSGQFRLSGEVSDYSRTGGS